MGVKRRAFLIGGTVVLGGGFFGLKLVDNAVPGEAAALVTGPREHGFAVWVKIAEDNWVTLYSPHVDLGGGSHTALAQMLAEELDCDFAKLRVEQAPAATEFINKSVIQGALNDRCGLPRFVQAMLDPALRKLMPSFGHQPTWGSMTVAFTGQHGVRVASASVRKALIETAAGRLNVSIDELSTKDSIVTHVKSGRSLTYGELAAQAAQRALDSSPPLKGRSDFRIIGKDVSRSDIPSKVDGSLKYGIDLKLPDMRVATIAACPVRGGTLESIDAAPALSIKEVEQW